jgi:tetratricopeptide (TPR) repeat protein
MIFLLLLLIPLLFGPAPAFSQEPPSVSLLIEDGDHHWNLRELGAPGSPADITELDLAIAAYRQALASSPELLAVQWRLMRALCFKGDYATGDDDTKKKLFAEGKQLGERALDIIRKEASRRAGTSYDHAGPVELAAILSASPDVVGSFYWSMANLGLWALVYGKFQAAREGVAWRIRDLAIAVTIMDPTYEQGGGYLALGRLHHETPYIPLITGWVSDAKAVEYLRKANQIDSRAFVNRLYLADTLWDWNHRSRDEALTLLEGVVQDTPRAEYRVEDQAAQEKARGLLLKWRGHN